MSYLVICPFVHRPSFDAMWATLAPELKEGALVIDNTVNNLGAAASRNVGARRILDEGIDWLIDISPVTRFGSAGGRDLVEYTEANKHAWIIQSSTPVNWHANCWSRIMFERVGLMDENCYPVYGEDGDISYRVHTAAREDNATGTWHCFDTDAWVTGYGHSVRVAGIKVDMEKIWQYYELKWGGKSGQEQYTRPFNDPNLSLSFWPTPPDPRCYMHEGWKHVLG